MRHAERGIAYFWGHCTLGLNQTPVRANMEENNMGYDSNIYVLEDNTGNQQIFTPDHNFDTYRDIVQKLANMHGCKLRVYQSRPPIGTEATLAKETQND